jgi:hypothetical protein
MAITVSIREQAGCEYAFGDLGPAAETRREVLGELILQLKIADRLALEDRYLRVRGELRSYKIHLGSRTS